ncbi:hypothetical protein GGI25_005775 [Coemansia spiralis]|uniref:BZIP domain-containing protein n=2 Tax=Coemansia TaxID=4863 RepID=A0A9W8G1Q7_9FUNG|nr:hypothetical protein BX070DRAFT_234738 [Coemansia spiralis]KAJ1988553.1 hypothetical protein EDC05_005216 [Coemansia umbellata]KAJ2619917.1 hypothetical protein GGI26_005452 [Coemansia sp. RSA 1358]KAJ2670640.1 hypothetical protein GGI25_005775 [Coemansia spiralis]
MDGGSSGDGRVPDTHQHAFAPTAKLKLPMNDPPPPVADAASIHSGRTSRSGSSTEDELDDQPNRRRPCTINSAVNMESNTDDPLANTIAHLDAPFSSAVSAVAATANADGSHNSSGGGVMWKKDLSNLLTPQTITEQAQVRRRTRNREAARRSRQRQRKREQELVKLQGQLSDRYNSLKKEREEWRIINATLKSASDSPLQIIDPAIVANEDDVALAENINSIYAFTLETSRINGELGLLLDEIISELDSMINPE